MDAASASRDDGTSAVCTGEHVRQSVIEIVDMGEGEVSNRAVLSWLLIRVMKLNESTAEGAQCLEKL